MCFVGVSDKVAAAQKTLTEAIQNYHRQISEAATKSVEDESTETMAGVWSQHSVRAQMMSYVVSVAFCLIESLSLSLSLSFSLSLSLSPLLARTRSEGRGER